MLLRQAISLALRLAEDKVGRSNAARIAIIAMMTSSSINVKARLIRSIDTLN